MQAQRPSAPLAASLKRLRCMSFPGAFEEQLLRLFAARSAFIRAQLECLGDDTTSGRLDLPEETGAVWLDCILSTPAELRRTDEKTLAAYLTASEFLQDWDMVKELCSLLGGQLLKAGPEAGTSAQQASRKQHIAQVLGDLSSNLVMEVLRSAPGTLTEQVAQLPESLASLAALAHIPALAAQCSPAQDCTEQSSCSDFPVLTLCVDTSQVQPAVDEQGEVGVPATSEHDIARAAIWPRMADVLQENIKSGLFTLEQRPRVVVCRLRASNRTLQNVTVSLPNSTCLLFGPETGALTLQDVTFQGGAVVCWGASCQSTFHDTVFDGCSLIVASAAQATLERPKFGMRFDSAAELSLFVHGAASKVAVQGGTVTGGIQGVTVQAGAHLEATELSISEVEVLGVEVRDKGSCLNLSGCKLEDPACVFRGDADESDYYGHEEDPVVYGVHVHSYSSAYLSSVSVSGNGENLNGRHGVGVCVDTHATATLVDSNVSNSIQECVGINGGATGHLNRCTLSGSADGPGLYVFGTGSSADATNCSFEGFVALARGGSKVTAVSCTSGSGQGGWSAEHNGTVLELTDCASDQNVFGCQARQGGKLIATRVNVRNSVGAGFEADTRGELVLHDCSAKDCGIGVVARDEGSMAHVEGCTFQNNGDIAVTAAMRAVVAVEGCHSRNHRWSGYVARDGGQMTVSRSVSKGDDQGCRVHHGGELTMEEVTVDGILQSGKL